MSRSTMPLVNNPVEPCCCLDPVLWKMRSPASHAQVARRFDANMLTTLSHNPARQRTIVIAQSGSGGGGVEGRCISRLLHKAEERWGDSHHASDAHMGHGAGRGVCGRVVRCGVAVRFPVIVQRRSRWSHAHNSQAAKISLLGRNLSF